MKWYQPFIKEAAAKPPTYLLERVSDLNHACEVAKTAPREANKIIAQVITDLSTQHDDVFAAPLQEAEKIMLDSPFRAISAVQKVVASMMLEKELKEDESEEKIWNKSKQT